LLLINGIGASLEALEPFVTALDGAVEVIRFDPPDIGGPGSDRLGGGQHGPAWCQSWGTAERPVARVLLPARRRRGLVRRPVPALAAAAGADPGRGRRPDHPAGNARLMHRLVRDSRLHVYPGGHLGLLTEAARLAPVVDGFLAGP
jgi:hypothetical protein